MRKILLFILIPVISYGQVQIGQDINGEASGDLSSSSLSLSTNGNVIAVGAIGNDGNGNDSGHVRIYERINGDWAQIGQDINGEASGNFSGSSVSLSSDGRIIAIGAPSNINNGSQTGHVRVYENINGNWTQIGQDIDGENSNEGFGSSVTLSSDGSILACGAPNNGGQMFPGRVVIYENLNGDWTQIGQDIIGEAEDDFSGTSIHLSSDGSIVAIGAPSNDGSEDLAGHVRIYENQEGNWTQIGQDIDGEDDFNLSGESISLSSNGGILAIGATLNDGNGNFSGHVRVYENINGNWTQIGQDIDGENAGDHFGESVSISGNGNIIAIGANFNSDFSGYTKIYLNQQGVWTQIGQNIIGEAESDQSGKNVSLSSDGYTLAIGANRNDENGNNSGHVRVFSLSDLLSTEEFTTPAFSLYPNPASTQITIDIPKESILEKATIYNYLGQFVLSSKSTTINTSTLSKGVYIVEVLTNQGASSKKLIIE